MENLNAPSNSFVQKFRSGYQMLSNAEDGSVVTSQSLFDRRKIPKPFSVNLLTFTVHANLSWNLTSEFVIKCSYTVYTLQCQGWPFWPWQQTFDPKVEALDASELGIKSLGFILQHSCIFWKPEYIPKKSRPDHSTFQGSGPKRNNKVRTKLPIHPSKS